MAAHKPAKAPTLYEGGHDKSTNCRAAWPRRKSQAESIIMKAVVALVVALSACRQQPTPIVDNSSEVAVPADRSEAKPAAKAFEFEENADLIEFHYGWSAEAAAIPQLVERFRKDMAKVKADLLKGATEDKAMRDKEGFDFHGYMSSTDYETAGQTSRLLSLRVEAGSFTGGAHGNSGTAALLWDRQAARRVNDTDLFAEAANRDRVLTQRWCDALNKAREEKRGTPVAGNEMFDECPKLEEIAVIPADKDGNGRFERLLLVASPYVAGPYAEGSYEIELAVTPDVIAALKSDYRSGFESPQAQ